MKRRLLIFVLFVSLMPLLVGFAPRRQQIALTLDVEAGYAGFYRRGQWTPVRVNVSNDGANLDGYVRVRMGELGGLEETIYRTPVDLPRGSRKQVFLYVSLENFAQSIQVEIVDESEHVVKQQTVNLRMTSRGDVLYGVVTESPYGAVDLAARPVGTGIARQVNWQAEDIPPFAGALAGLDVILMHEVDTGSLRPEQVDALSEWVLSGGHLIVAGGDSWQRTTAQLTDLLPVTLQGTVPLDTATAFGTYLRQTSELLDEAMTATMSTPDATAQVLLADGDIPLLVRGRHGAGWVDFVAVDPNAEPLRSWTGTRDLWYTLITSVGQQPSWSNGFTNWTAARNGTLTTANTVLPTFLQLCGFLMAYIVLIGPVNYLLLKRLNRREWAWVSIPVLIVFFSVLAYRVGFNLRGNLPVVNRLNVVRVWPGQEHDKAQVLTLVGVQSPRRLYYDVTAERGYALRTLPEGGIGINVPVTINEGTRFEAQDVLIDGGTVGSLVANGYESAPRLESSAEWHLAVGEPARLSGSITNTTGVTLEDAVIVIKGEARALETLEPGETVTFDIPVGPQSPGALTLGTDYQWAATYSYTPWQSRNNYGGCFWHSGVPLTIPHVMQGDQFICSVSRVTPRQHEIRRRYQLLGALVVDQDESGGRDSGAYLFAWSKEPYMDVALGSRNYSPEDTTLYVFELPVTVAADAQQIEIPPGLTTWTYGALDDPSTMRGVHPETSFQIADADQAVFEFRPMSRLHLDRVEELLIQFQGQGDVKVHLWDWQRQMWIRVNLDPNSDTTVLRNAARYIGPENAVQVRIAAPDSISYNRVQYIKVGYRGWLDN